MSIYQRITNRPLPAHTLILPLQYLLFGESHHCVMFTQMGEEVGRGTSKRVQRAFVREIVGQVPLPEISSLTGKEIVLYRPRENDQAFINDIIGIVKLYQKQVDMQVKSNIAKIKGHSLYVTKDYQGTEGDYSRLLYEGYLKLTPSVSTLLDILRSALGASPEIEALMGEILRVNDLVDTPFMIGDILPFSVHEKFPTMSVPELLNNLYQMVSTVVSYALEGVFFRDLQPDNFRLDAKGQIKLIDPSYIDSSVSSENRLVLFIRETTPEYLPGAFAFLQRRNEQEKLARYLGKFTEGVCVGMLERVIKRIMLPGYMARYDSLCQITKASDRIEAANRLKFQEDLDFFHEIPDKPPTPADFQMYQISAAEVMSREGVYRPELILPVSRLLTVLRHYSYPSFSATQCYTSLQNREGQILPLAQLPSLAMGILNIRVEPHKPRLDNTRLRLKPEGQAEPISRIVDSESAKLRPKPEGQAEPIPRIVDPESAKLRPKLESPTPADPPSSPAFAGISEPKLRAKPESENLPAPKRIGTLITKRLRKGGIYPQESQVEDDVIFEETTETAQGAGSKDSASAPEETCRESQLRDFSSNTLGVMKYIDQELMGVKKLVKGNEMVLGERIEDRFRKAVGKNAEDISDSLKEFLKKADSLLQSQEIDLHLLRLTRSLIPEDLHARLKPLVQPEYKHHFFPGSGVGQRCRKVLMGYLVRTVKCRYLKDLEPNQELDSLLPLEGEDLLEFICQHEWTSRLSSVEMLANSVIQEAAKSL